VARNILLANGNAADAAVALGFALTVTLPSSAGLGGGGACLVHDAQSGVTEAIVFTSPANDDTGAARYRAAVPALPRGLFALHAKYGRVPWSQVVAPAENLARFGHTVTRAFARDLAADGGALMNDRTALTAFMTPRRQMLQAGDAFKQIDLATSLSRLRARGPGDVGRALEDAVAAAGGAVTAAQMRSYVPQWIAPVNIDDGGQRLFVLPASVAGGEFKEAHSDVNVPSGATGFVVGDADGNVVACALTMGHAFGLGLMPAGAGFLLAPSPDAPGADKIQLAPVIGLDRTRKAVVFAGAAAGIDAIGSLATRAKMTKAPVESGSSRRAGFINMLTCDANENRVTCEAQNDPRGSGYALTLGPKD